MGSRNRNKHHTGGTGIDVQNPDALAAELPRLRRYARALLRDPVAADDLVQDCLERALARQHQFRDGTNLRAWLFTIMHSIHVNTRQRLMRAADAVELFPAAEERNGTAPGQGHGLIIRDLAAALDRLPLQQREIVLLIGLEDMSYRQAAEIVQVPVGTVMSRLARGRERLRRLMDGDDTPLLRSVK